MRDAVRIAFPTYTVSHEGRVRCMYLDTIGVVTSGIGFAFLRAADAQALGWLREDLQLASPTDVTNEWRQVESLQGMRGQSWRNFLHVTHLRATDSSIDALFARKMAAAETAMITAFPAWLHWCSDAQFVSLSYYWALGRDWPNGRFPHCSALLRAERWDATLAIDPSTGRRFCEMHVPANANVSLRQRAIDAVRMWENAAIVASRGLDPAVLHFPAQVTAAPIP